MGSNGDFRPSDPVTRAELAVIMQRYHLLYNADNTSITDELPLVDTDPIEQPEHETNLPQGETQTTPTTQNQDVNLYTDSELPDSDPVMGRDDAPITMVIFTDTTCYPCKRFETNTLPELIVQYVDSGALRIVMRDFPYPYHEPNATREAIALNCLYEQADTAAYYGMREIVFEHTLDQQRTDQDYLDIVTDVYPINA